MTWPQRVQECKNCRCERGRRAYGKSGYCSLCSYALKKIEEAKRWDWNNPATLTNPATALRSPDRTADDFEVARQEFIRQAEARLSALRLREERRSGLREVEPLVLEYKFADILKLIAPKANYPHDASYLEAHFNREERRAIYGLLDDLAEHERWRGFSLLDAFDAIRAARGKQAVQTSKCFGVER